MRSLVARGTARADALGRDELGAGAAALSPRSASDRPSWRSSGSARITGRNSEVRASRSARSPSPRAVERGGWFRTSVDGTPHASLPRLAAAYREVAGAAGILSGGARR
jgi:hypothetical protein